MSTDKIFNKIDVLVQMIPDPGVGSILRNDCHHCWMSLAPYMEKISLHSCYSHIFRIQAGLAWLSRPARGDRRRTILTFIAARKAAAALGWLAAVSPSTALQCHHWRQPPVGNLWLPCLVPSFCHSSTPPDRFSSEDWTQPADSRRQAISDLYSLLEPLQYLKC